MTQYAVAELSATTSTFVEAAQADEMADALNVILQAAGGGNVILSLALAGGGDGHTFVVSVERSTSAGTGTPLTNENIIGCYLAASEDELAVARAACITALLAAAPQGTTLRVIDDQLAGASKGTRFMGMIVTLSHGGG